MADLRNAEGAGSVAGLLLPLVVGRHPALLSIDERGQLLPGPDASPESGVRRSYRVTVTEGRWDDWFVSVAVADEGGRRIALAAKDDASLSALLPDLMVEVGDAVVEDFLARRPAPGRLEELRRALVCRLLWMRNLCRRARDRRESGGKASRRTAGRR